jgi:hypothetical protein
VRIRRRIINTDLKGRVLSERTEEVADDGRGAARSSTEADGSPSWGFCSEVGVTRSWLKTSAEPGTSSRSKRLRPGSTLRHEDVLQSPVPPLLESLRCAPRWSPQSKTPNRKEAINGLATARTTDRWRTGYVEHHITSFMLSWSLRCGRVIIRLLWGNCPCCSQHNLLASVGYTDGVRARNA